MWNGIVAHLSHHFADDMLAVAASILLVLAIVFFASRYHRWASPWCGVGDEVDSFEDLLSVLRLVAGPAALIAAAAAVGFLGYKNWSKPDLDFLIVSVAHHELPKPATERETACSCPTSSEPGGDALATCRRSGCTEAGIVREIDAALTSLTRSINDLAHGIEGRNPADILKPLVDKLNEIEKAIGPASDNGQYHDLIASIKDIKNTLGSKTPAIPKSVLEHLILIEAVLSSSSHASAPQCNAPPDPAHRTPSENSLIKSAEKDGLKLGQDHRIAERQIFFDAGAVEPSDVGKRLLADIARNHAGDLAIHAQADAVSDGLEPEDKAHKRADALAKYLAPPGTVVRNGISWDLQHGTESEPYRRMARIYLLEPCVARAKPKGAIFQDPGSH
jgi:hypothetical protein